MPNITPLNGGPVGLDNDISSSLGQDIQAMVSENNLRANLNLNDPSMKGLYNVVYTMVQRWLPGDKARILEEYGAAGYLQKGMSEKDLNKNLAIVLISRLPKHELEKITNKIKKEEFGLTKEIAQAETKASQYAKKLTKQITQNSEQEIKDATQTATNNKQFTKSVAAATSTGKNDKNAGFYIDKYNAEALAGLRRELKEVLKLYSDGYLLRLISILRIENEEGSTSKQTLMDRINNSINCYVALILGKAKGIHASAFSPEAIVEIEKILSLTSFGWVTGKVGTTDMMLKDKRKLAGKIKREQDAMQRNMSAKTSVTKNNGKNGRSLLDKKGEVKVKTKGKNSSIEYNPDKSFLKGNLQKLYTHYKEMLYETLFGQKVDDTNKPMLDATTHKNGIAEIRKLALAQGIDDAESADPLRLVTQLAQMMANQADTMNKDLALAIKKAKTKEEVDAATQTFKDQQSTSIVGSLIKNEKALSQSFSDQIPVIEFNNKGELVSEALKSVVPVWVVGMGGISKGATGLSKEEIKKRKSTDGDESDNLMAAEVVSRNSGLESYDVGKKSKIKKNKKNDFLQAANEQARDDAIKMLSTAPMQQTSVAQPVAQQQAASVSTNVNAGNTNVTVAASNSTRTNKNSHNNFTKKDLKNIDDTLQSKKILHVSDIKKFVSEELAMNIFKKSEIDLAGKVIPVVDLNHSHTDIIDIKKDTTDINNSIKSVDDSINGLYKYFATLQMGGTAFNAASSSIGIGVANKLISDAQNAAATSLRQATGGSMKAGASVSSVITGDAMRGTGNKANPELVSVDWNTKRINVKPIPAMATGGTVETRQKKNSNVQNVSRLTSGERNSPLSVGISSGLVNYTKQLSDVQDDNSKTAIKVYSINSGINEKIHIGSADISLFDAVYGIYGSISQIQTNMTTNSQYLATIASNTSIIAQNSKQKNNSQTEGFTFPTEFNTILEGR